MSEDMNSRCIGCPTYLDPENYFIACCYSHENYESNPCPCTICIVKAMCEDPCDKFDVFAGDL